MMKFVVIQADPGVENPSEVKSEPKPVPVENGLSHAPSAAPKPASQISTQPQSTGQSFTQLNFSYKTINPYCQYYSRSTVYKMGEKTDMHESYVMKSCPVMIQAQQNQRQRLKI